MSTAIPGEVWRKHLPNMSSIWALSKKLETKETLLDEYAGGHLHILEETIQNLKDQLRASPMKLLRRLSQESVLSGSICQHAAKKKENPNKIVKRTLSDKSNGVPPAKMVRSNSVNNDEIQKTSLASTSFCTISPRKPTTSNLLDRPANIQRPVTPHLDLKKVTETLKNKNICPSTMTFGFLGLGIMGSGIVKNLLHSGHTVIVWNRNPDKVEVMGGGGKRVLDDAVHSASMALSFFFPPLPLGVSHGESCNGK
uniref:6-phosphogluconate dehydrogenase NADP-binding domain-containing protein n=1 Tax=Timema shepardi TaxID=629360 RepID=A0A7R9AQF9_TIMSH|nr:unnamed protein product [Timema shepardi]